MGLVAVALLAGCSTLTEREVDYKAGAIKAQPLEVPPNLTTQEADQRYTIPGKDGEKVASYSEYTKQKTEQPCVAPTSAPPAPVKSDPVPAARLQDSKGSKKILLNEPFDRSWRLVGLALDSAKLVTTDKDRSKGIYYVAPAAPNTDTKAKRPDYQVVVREIREGSEVTVANQNGKSDAEAAHLIELIYQNLDKKQ
ncbi:MAG: outer membrane protein assembly factor BamC [Nitrosomonadales bacterium]|nr:outer membrane protein assembly factor BamC [Nitrosomonadales bacterium]